MSHKQGQMTRWQTHRVCCWIRWEKTQEDRSVAGLRGHIACHTMMAQSNLPDIRLQQRDPDELATGFKLAH